jgi:ADP-ribosylglycohydrolase
MRDNVPLLNELLGNGVMRLARGALLSDAPGPMPPEFDFGRVEGMMLGLAIGDALGNTSEGRLPSARAASYGEIRDYLPNSFAGGRRMGVPSDDTQLAFWTLEQLIADRGFDPARVAKRFSQDQIFGIGQSVREFLANTKSGMAWYASGTESAGNGALMRIAPMLIPHLRTGSPGLWADAALSGRLTHNDSASNAACVAFVSMLWQLLQMSRPPEPEWWLRAYVDAAKTLETDKSYRPRGGQFIAYEGPLWQYVEERCSEAHRLGLPTVDACNAWHSGAFLLETMPCVIYILMQHGHQPEEAIIRAVNDTKDNDTVAAIVGAAVGALHGKDKLPERWVSGLLGRTTADDDGRIFELLTKAAQVFWPGEI